MIYTDNRQKFGTSGCKESPLKKSKSQGKRQYRYEVPCKSCGIQINNDHFAKHNQSKHEGRGPSQQIIKGNQTKISFAKVLKVGNFVMLQYIVVYSPTAHKPIVIQFVPTVLVTRSHS